MAKGLFGCSLEPSARSISCTSDMFGCLASHHSHAHQMSGASRGLAREARGIWPARMRPRSAPVPSCSLGLPLAPRSLTSLSVPLSCSFRFGGELPSPAPWSGQGTPLQREIRSPSSSLCDLSIDLSIFCHLLRCDSPCLLGLGTFLLFSYIFHARSMIIRSIS